MKDERKNTETFTEATYKKNMTKEKCANEMQKVVKQKTFAEFNNVRHTHTHRHSHTHTGMLRSHTPTRTHTRPHYAQHV